jgi:hypothetical protein
MLYSAVIHVERKVFNNRGLKRLTSDIPQERRGITGDDLTAGRYNKART